MTDTSKQYVVLLSGTNVTVNGRTFTMNAGAMVPEGTENIEHLLDVKCIGEVGEHTDLLVSAGLTGQDPAVLTGDRRQDSPAPVVKPPKGA